MAEARNRPISPHLTDGFRLHWRWGPAMLASILNRATGTVNAVAGLGLLLWWLGALVSGPDAYASLVDCAATWYGKVVLIGITASVFIHAMLGLRHFVLDIGAGFELDTNRLWSILSPLIGLALTAGFWAVLLTR